ncbi:MAG: LysR family transcriptional regulator, partial [Sneathiella sp.]
MNWKTTHFDWNHARGFLATVEGGSLSAAARLLGVTQPTLSRQISALEITLGVTLFERGHRSSALTESGLELVDHVRAMFEAAEQVSLVAAGQAQSVKGRVVITTSDMIACYYLPAILRSLRDVAPDIQIELIVSNTLQDLKKREADIAIRHARPTQPDLIAKRIGDLTAHFAASKGYLDRRGRPKTLADMNGHDFIGFETPQRSVQVF